MKTKFRFNAGEHVWLENISLPAHHKFLFHCLLKFLLVSAFLMNTAGAHHADEYVYLFGPPEVAGSIELTDNDITYQRVLLNSLIQFIKTGSAQLFPSFNGNVSLE